MCTRFLLKYRDAINVCKRLGISLAQLIARDRYNIAPSHSLTAIRTDESAATREAVTLQWGLVPHWLNAGNSRTTPLVNARAETLLDKPSFRTAWQRRQRCVIPASGFYEWERIARDRQPWMFTRTDGKPFVFAGLWDRWTNPADGTIIESCAVITTTPNALLARIHHRMPVLFDESTAAAWLDPACPDALSLLRPFDADRLIATALDPHVNSSRHDDPACLTPRLSTTPVQTNLTL